MKSDEFENLGDLLDHYKVKKIEFGRAMGWARSITYMKLDRQRAWSVLEYEDGLKILRQAGIRIARNTMMMFATQRGDDGNS